MQPNPKAALWVVCGWEPTLWYTCRCLCRCPCGCPVGVCGCLWVSLWVSLWVFRSPTYQDHAPSPTKANLQKLTLLMWRLRQHWDTELKEYGYCPPGNSQVTVSDDTCATGETGILHKHSCKLAYALICFRWWVLNESKHDCGSWESCK
jgi:hypothetical protein